MAGPQIREKNRILMQPFLLQKTHCCTAKRTANKQAAPARLNCKYVSFLVAATTTYLRLQENLIKLTITRFS